MPAMSKPANSDNYAIIGAGLGRTATTSLRAALEQILGPTYHMDAMLLSKSSSDTDFWTKAQKRRATEEDWKRFVGDRGLKAGVDYPMSFYWREQLKVFPNAKVILTVRSPDSWYRSVKGTLLNTNRNYWASWAPRLFARLVGRHEHVQICDDICWAIPDGFDISLFGAVSEGQERAVEFFNRWAEEVKATVPKERLLVFEAKDGWEPLCKFLDVPIPSNPYPLCNDVNTRGSQETILKTVVYASVYGIPALVVAAVMYFFL